MKNYIEQFDPSLHSLSRRHWGILALIATLSACGGGDAEDDEAVAPLAYGQVVPSAWSDAVPALRDGNSGMFVARDYAGVGASGLIYVNGTEILDGKYEFVLRQYKNDGTFITLKRLSTSINYAHPEQIAVIEEDAADQVLISVAFTVSSGMVNKELTAGGYIARLNTKSGETTKLFESSTICPGGLARDNAGNLYTVDMKTGDVLQLSADKNEITVIYKAKPGKSDFPGIDADFVLESKCTVAVTNDGTVYAMLVAAVHPASSASYSSSSQWIVRVRNGQADRIQPGLADGEEIGGFGVHGNDVFCLVNGLVRKIDTAGVISTVAGTPGSNKTTQFGSPGALGRTTQWIDLSPDGRIIYLRQAQESPRFYSVLLPVHN